MAGIVDSSDRALRYALKGDEDEVAAEMGWLDDPQLRRLIEAAKLLLKRAEMELMGREP